MTYAFYHDSALTTPVTTLDPVTATQDELDTLSPVDKQVWIGAPDAGLVAKAHSNPGVDEIVVSILDVGAGAGETVAAIALATSQAGLDSAVPGDPLSIGTQILSGIGNAATIWLRLNDTTGVLGVYTDVYPVVNTLRLSYV